MDVNFFKTGNCTELISELPPDCIDLTVTSPPYDDLRNYKGYEFDYKKIADALLRATKPGGIVVWVVGDKIANGNRTLTSFRQALYFQEIGWLVHDDMIYRKKNTPFGRTNAYINCYEHMFVFSKGKPKTFNPLRVRNKCNDTRMMSISKDKDGVITKGVRTLLTEGKRKNIWEYEGCDACAEGCKACARRSEEELGNIWAYAVGLGGTTMDKIAFRHPAVFPEKLAEDHILSWSNEGELVLDPMCGSGTVPKMAFLNNRKYIGFDISNEYIETVAKPRLADIARQKTETLL